MGIRFFVVLFLFSILYGSLALKFYNIQIRKGDYYSAKAASQILGKSLDPARGNIFFTDKNGTSIPVAVKKNYPFIYCIPEEMMKAGVDLKEAAARVEETTGISESELVLKFNRPDDPFEELMKITPEETAKRIKELSIPGLYVGEKPKRFYPYEKLASHILGFVANDAGQYGVESFYDKKLSGNSGVASGDTFVLPIDGEDVYLAIDQIIQARAEKILADAILKHNAAGGLVIVSNPKTGEIKAIAGNPSFDPNNYGSSDMSVFMNPAIQSVYEPGSVFKLVTMSSAIDSGSVTPETSYIDNGSLTINGRTIQNWDKKAHGRLTMTEVIERSINTGTVFASRKMGKDIFFNYIKKFGLTEKTGIDLPGETVGSTKSLVGGSDINYATASYGQGISVSPIRMLAAVNAIANKGVMMVPRVAKGDVKEASRPISEDTAKKITDMMVSAVVKNILADIPGYNIAGKTGTAMVPDLKKGGYKDTYINTYVGFAPAYDPEFSVLIRIDEPEGNPLAGASVVPAFKELTQFILSYYGVAPDKIIP